MIKKHGGVLRFFRVGEPVAAITADNVDVLAEVDDGARVFQLAWVIDQRSGDVWILAEDTVAQAASDAAHA